MFKLLIIDLKKLIYYRTFWVLVILYSLLVVSIPISVMEFLKWLKMKGADFDGFDPLKIPVLYFPDIWQNITYVYTFLKIFLAIVVIISVSNEFVYKTIRQNVIDGMSRLDFVKSKLMTITFLAIGSTLLVFLTGLVTGLIYTPNLRSEYIFSEIEFVLAYFLDLFAYLILAFLLTLWIKRSGLAIALMVLLVPIEYTIAALLPDSLEFIGEYLPFHAMNDLISVPFPKYIFMEIKDWVGLEAVVLVFVYVALFVYLIRTKLKTTDL